MAALARPDPNDFPDSPYAAQLRRADPHRRFSAPLEAEYVHADLLHNRALIRTVNLCAVLMTAIHFAEQLYQRPAGALLVAQLAVLTAVSVVLAALAWRPALERGYLPWANVLVPLRSLVGASHVAAIAAHGEITLLMSLPIMVIAPFFFFGLRFRTALFTGVVTITSFAAGATLFHLAVPIAGRADLYLLIALTAGAIAARQLERHSRIAFLERHLVAELAQRDALTGTLNRRVFNEHLARTWQQAAAEQRPLAVLLIDVDHFKDYNDHYGHLAGDQALRRVAQAVQGLVRRPLDLLARYGGEEFGVIVHDVDSEQAWALAEHMRRAVMQLGIEHRSSPVATMLTISIGIAVVEPTAASNCWGALQLADLALYEAKLSGRNCIDLMDDAEYRLLSTGGLRAGSGAAPVRVAGGSRL
ncbi:MAG: diguanylate cyclase domain-containing protein [Steroidobacteraceae bacterium]